MICPIHRTPFLIYSSLSILFHRAIEMPIRGPKLYWVLVMRQNQGQRPPKIAPSLARAFLQPDNTLLLHSKGLEILPALAQSLYQEKSHLTLLVDFPSIDVQQLNYHLREIKQDHTVMGTDSRGDRPEVATLNKMVREKRRKHYVQGGIYALTTQIMLLDCLSDSGDLPPGLISRVVVRDGEHEVNDKYGLVVWLATLLTLNANKTAITVVSSRASRFRGDRLEQMMRLLYMKKVVLWPFGRSEIHGSLQHSPVVNLNHKLTLDSAETTLHECFLQLLKYCQKSPLDARKVESLCGCLLNCSKLDYLVAMEQLVQGSSDYSIWKSSNTNVIELVDQVIRLSRNCVLALTLCQGEGKENTELRTINLVDLVPHDATNGPPSEVLYKLSYEIHVPGLGQAGESANPFYPAKLIEIIKEVTRNCEQLDKLARESKPIEEEKAMVESLIAQSLSSQKQGGKGKGERERIVYVSTSGKEVAKQLHHSLFCWEHKQHYMAHLRKLFHYLQLKLEERVGAIERVIKKQVTGQKSSTQLHLEHEPILLQELYLELKRVLEVVDTHAKLKGDDQQRDCLLSKDIARLDLRYVDRAQLSLQKEYNAFDDCVLTIQLDHLWRVKFCIQANTALADLTQILRVVAPHSIFFYSPNTSFIRHLNVSYSQELLVGAEKIHTVYFNNSLESERVVKVVKEEDEAFWGIAQERKKLGEYKESPEVRIKELVIDDDIQKKARTLALAAATQAKNSRNEQSYINSMDSFRVERVVLVDKREFKSLLPSYLFHHGFKVIPVFLENADYILSNDVGIEKKSVHTRDLHESLKSGRLGEQMKRLCSKFAHPYLLIECPDLSYFKREEFSNSFNKISGQKYSLNIRRQLVQLVHRFPKINLLWSTNYLETIRYFVELKRNREEPDLAKFKPQGEDELEVIEEEKGEQRDLETDL